MPTTTSLRLHDRPASRAGTAVAGREPIPAGRDELPVALPPPALAARDELCRVLLICDDDVAAAELRRALGERIVADQVLGQGRERRLALAIEEVALRGTWEIAVRDQRQHLAIVATTGESPLAVLAGNPVLRANIGAVLYLVDAGFDAAATGRDRRPGDRVLAAPFTTAALRAEVERLLLAALAMTPAQTDDDQYLSFLTALVRDGRRTLRPLPAVVGAGHAYPAVADHFGPGANHAAILDRLVELGLCRRIVARRVRTCPACAAHQLIWGEVCARCGSPDFARETIIHHFACAHMDSEAAFAQADAGEPATVGGGALTCPKCRKTLRQIGRDYEKPTGCCRCRACAFISTDTRIQATCQCCQAVCEPDQVGEQVLHAYELTAKADEAVRAQDLGGHHMASVLRNRATGLYARSYFLHTLGRELDRRRRYAAPVALVAVRADFLAALRITSLERYGDQVEAVWTAATSGLRVLDMPTVWEEGVLVILLPGTPLAGAEVVARRIAATFAARGDGAVLALAAVEAGDAHADAEALVQAALDRLGGGDGTGTAAGSVISQAGVSPGSSELVVLEDDDGVRPAAGA